MRKLGIVFVIALLAAACGGDSDSADDGGSGDSGTNSSGSPDPCTLAGDSVLVAYFGDAAVESEQNQYGPVSACSWRDANSNSLTIQSATDHDLFRPERCDECLDLSFGDDGYASPSPLQSTATVVSGNLWLSVSTTGFGDDGTSIADLLETVFQNATG